MPKTAKIEIIKITINNSTIVNANLDIYNNILKSKNTKSIY